MFCNRTHNLRNLQYIKKFAPPKFVHLNLKNAYFKLHLYFMVAALNAKIIMNASTGIFVKCKSKSPIMEFVAYNSPLKIKGRLFSAISRKSPPPQPVNKPITTATSPEFTTLCEIIYPCTENNAKPAASNQFTIFSRFCINLETI